MDMFIGMMHTQAPNVMDKWLILGPEAASYTNM
jgi:hypothetical protein